MENAEDALVRGLVQAIEWAMMAPGLDPYSLEQAEHALQIYLFGADPASPFVAEARRALKLIAEGP